MEQPKATVFKLLRETAPRHFEFGAGSGIGAGDLSKWEATLTRGFSREFVEEMFVGSRVSQPVPRVSELITLAFQNAPEGIVIIRPQRDTSPPVIEYVNDAYCRMTGVDRVEVIGRELQIFRVTESDQAVRDALLHPLCQRRAFEGEAVAARKNGSTFAVELLLVPIHGEDSEVSYWVAYLKDITDRKAQLAALERQALHDVLTQLPNRTLLLDRVDQAILMGRRTDGCVGLMVMDLDGFKEVNDTLGHHAGDILLQKVAVRLRGQLRESDTVARLGGDEFAFVCPTIEDAESAMRLARKILRALETPFDVDGQDCQVGASVGIAVFPQHGTDAATLLKRADAAMYQAKKTGRGYAVYSAELARSSTRNLSLAAELRNAIEDHQLRVHYQPKIHLRTGIVTRVEALVRWKHPKHGLLLPDHFIPLAERTGLIKPLTEWVIDQSLRQVYKWQQEGLPIHVAVNLSSKILQEHALPQTIAALLEKTKVPPHALKLEITESSIMLDPPHVLAILSLLQTLGVRLSLDDFGTGYSSLMHLRQLPVDEIKIDKSFVMGMSTSASDAAIVRATIDLGHSLGRQVVAEGVDDDRTCRTLTALGCDLAQGYSFSRPLPAAAFEQWLHDTAWGHNTWRELLLDQVPFKEQG